MNLVIVESPAKAKTIENYLGRNYKVTASFGHVRDLPSSVLGIDIEKNYLPKYQTLPKARKILSAIKENAAKADIVYLATDLDREGEAISWHLMEAIKPKDKGKYKRIVFNEITKTAVENAIKNPRSIDINLVDAQQARRVLDRLVGYKLSPFLWKKVKAGLSAGRVQSVAVRLVVEREKEIRNFKPQEYWLLGVKLSKQKDVLVFPAYLVEADGKSIKKYDIGNKEEAEKFFGGVKEADFKVISVEKKESIRRAPAPFTTSTMQMEASRKLGFSPKQTMVLAQHLYEAGHITYMRTDSTNLSKEAVANIRSIILEKYGQKYLPNEALIYKTKAVRAQEAHEAIRPTHFEKAKVTEDARGQRLYDLIWKRTVAAQMNNAIFDVVNARIAALKTAKNLVFLATGEQLKFDGFIKVYTEGKDEEEDLVGTLPELKEDEILQFQELIEQQKFTEPPKRYSEATLVKKMESLGIGRPSTYAPTLDTIQQRGYVVLENRLFSPTEIGEIVNDLLVKHFDRIVDYKFTAKMEDELDDIADGKMDWTKVIDEFYKPFEKNLAEKQKEISKEDVVKTEILEEKCPKCGKQLVIKLGRFGKFKACSGFPECKYSSPLETSAEKKEGEIISDKGTTESLAEAISEKCEKCGGQMVLKEGRFGKFLACENYPKCKNTKTIVGKTGLKCPKCGEGEIIQKYTKRRKPFWGCSRYPKCDYATWENPAQKS